MTLQFHEQVSELKEKLLTMAGLAEQAVRRAMQALQTRDPDLAERVPREDDAIDRLEIEIDEDAVHLLAKAPLASDLRLVTVMMKISRDLERVGDEATSMARRALDLALEAPVPAAPELSTLSQIAIEMLNDALNAFVNQDPAAARAVRARDHQADALHKEIRKALVLLMSSQAQVVPRGVSYLLIAKSLERIADHATNIAEDVVYLCEALDIRHRPKEP